MHEGHRERMKARFIKEGLQGFEPHQALELFLFYSNPRSDTNELAHSLISRFGCISEVFNAPVAELCRVEGIGEHSAVLISMMPQLFRLYSEDAAGYHGVATPGEIGEFIKNKFLGVQVEKVLVVCLDNRFRVLGSDFVSEGYVNAATVNIRVLLELVMRHNATAAIIAHNHPRGFAIPSPEDIETTERIRDALDVVNVRLVDHLIVADNDYVSMVSSEKFKNLF